MEKKEIVESVVKSLFAAIPFAGQPLNELFYDFRGRVKQNRLNEFSVLLSEYFSSNGIVDFSTLNIVEFSDLFEAVIFRVANTGSKEKHRRFRDILIGYIEHPGRQMDHTDTFLELVAVLTEPAIQILKYHFNYDLDFNRLTQLERALEQEISKTVDKLEKEDKMQRDGLANNYSKFETELREQKVSLVAIQEEKRVLSKYRGADFYGLSDDDFLYLKQILASRALMTDVGIGSIGHVQFFNMSITMFGRHFINYIREGNP